MMKKITLLFILALSVSFANAQDVFNQNYESLSIGASEEDAGHGLIEGGTAEVITGTGDGNTTKVLKATHLPDALDMFLRTPLITVIPGEEYTATFDISTSNDFHIVTMKYSEDGETANFQVHPDVPGTSTNGQQLNNGDKVLFGRMKSTTKNKFGTTTVVFTVPAAGTGTSGDVNNVNRAEFQIYQYGKIHSFEVDNLVVTKTKSATASVADFKQFNFSHYPNPTTNNLNLSASKNIESVKIFNLLGQNLISTNPNTIKTSIDVSALNKGIYIMNATIDRKKASYKFIKE